MLVSQKSQYALRAILELSVRYKQGWTKISDIADAQAIPPRFLEVILSQLKQAGFVTSRRGTEGGYVLVRPPEQLTVGEVLRFVQGPVGPVDCVADQVSGENKCPLYGDCVFLPLWKRVEEAISGVYDSTTFQDLVDQYNRNESEYVPCYAI
jgi:Rrf2 family protein